MRKRILGGEDAYAHVSDGATLSLIDKSCFGAGKRGDQDMDQATYFANLLE